MADYADMPGLVDNPWPTGAPGGTPYHPAGLAESTSSTSWGAERERDEWGEGSTWRDGRGEASAWYSGWNTEPHQQQQQQQAVYPQQWPVGSPNTGVQPPPPFPTPTYMTPTTTGYPAFGQSDAWVHRVGEPMHAEQPGAEPPWKRSPESASGLSMLPSLRRAHSRSGSAVLSSQSSSPASSSSLSRTHSVSTTHERKLQPPQDWRSEFSMTRSPLSQALNSMFKQRRSSSVSSFSLPFNAEGKWPKLHPYLRHNPTSPPMWLDVRLSARSVQFREIRRQVVEWDLTRFACEPPITRMRFYSPHFPWVVDVQSANPVGVTLQELLNAIWTCMMTPITRLDYYNCEMDDAARGRVADAWSQRCRSEEERQQGVRRVDFLLERVMLEGFSKGRDGMWEMKLQRL